VCSSVPWVAIVMDFETSAGVVTYRWDKGQVEPLFLILHYEEGHWDLPKGHLERGESLEAAALRELKEETGISDARLAAGFKEKITYNYRRGGRMYTKNVYFFIGETKSEAVALSPEHTDYKWLEYADALGVVTYGTAREILKKAYLFLNGKQQ